MQPVERTIRIAVAGNPNAGKTTIFNLLTGLHQQVGNWPGVTVERKTGTFRHGGYRFEVVDLPGTYSLTAYTIEERVAREYVLEARPDVVIDVIDTANLERNLYLTMQLLETGVDVVAALNMWDEFTRSGARLARERLESLLGTPVVPTVGHRGQGRTALLEAVIGLVEARREHHRHVPISFGPQVEAHVRALSEVLVEEAGPALAGPARYYATQLLEGDPHTVEVLHNRLPDARRLLGEAEARRARIRAAAGRDASDLISDGRRGFVHGLLREVLSTQAADRMEFSRNLDRILTNRWLGFPIFVGFMWLLFNATFVLGAYPSAAIEWLVAQVGTGAMHVLPAGWVRELLVDGVIAGVGSVAVFLPSILILFLGIALLEDTGYMARAAFIMDRVMHMLGLHGKSFIPMLMGFGCTVPAIMATRTLESRRDRILTSLLVPHMSCSARLPVYVLFAGAFFERHAGNVILAIYLLGILVAVAVGRLLSRTLFRQEAAAFVMELPPYRWPTGRGLLMHMWDRGRLYVRKMGGVILIASVVLWALSVFPKHPQTDAWAARRATQEAAGVPVETLAQSSRVEARAAVEHAVIGRVGKAIAPVLTPLGFTWEMGVTLLAGFVAKEVVVSSLGVLYQAGEGEQGLGAALRRPGRGITPLTAVGFMVFVLLYTPCIVAVLMIRRELGTGWMVFDIAYQLLLAWGAAFLVFQGGRLLGLG